MLRRLSFAILAAFALTGCETMDTGSSTAAAAAAVKLEAPGNYYIGRRMYKQDYKVWGWVRQPGQPWSTAKLVMLNEQGKLAPDRAQNRIGSDNNYEYKLYGYFSGDKVYEPASDTIYPEFVLQGYEIKDMNPPNIYKTKRENEPAVRILLPPA